MKTQTLFQFWPLIVILGVWVLPMIGCSSTDFVRPTPGRNTCSYDQLNAELKNQNVSVELAEGREVSASDVIILGDSLYWLDRSTKAPSKESLERTRKIVNVNHVGGAVECLGLGLAGFALLSVAMIGQQPETGLEVAFFAGVGVLSSPVIGLILGHKHNYVFTEMENERKSTSALVHPSSGIHDLIYLENGRVSCKDIIEGPYTSVEPRNVRGIEQKVGENE